ncbi:aflatoxin regulatory protein-domain-containing protein [Aspergillus unguis]
MEPTIVPLQQPGPAGSATKTRKLRESCISCSKSKVRCDKAKPTCRRCVRRGLPCEYTVSRRTGRTRVIGVEKATDTSSSQPVQTPTATCLQSPPSESELWSGIFSPDASSTELSSLLSISPDMGDLFACLPWQLETSGLDTDMQGNDASLSVTDTASLLQSLDDPDLLPIPTPVSKSGPCCLAVCLDILLRLCPNAQAGCERSGSRGSLKLCTIDSIIEDNKEIIDTVQTVLSCGCAEDGYVATLVSLILLKVLDWYVAARDQPSSSDGLDWTTSCITSHSPSIASSDEQLLHLPAVVGGYVDDHYQSRMAAQLVLSELHRVQRLITLVGQRLDGIRSQSIDPTSSSIPSVSTGLPSSTLSHLEDDLRKRLRAVSSETIDILRSA